MQPDDNLKGKRGFEEDILAILDSGASDDSHDIHEDRLAFLEAVRFASLVSDSPTTVTWKMHDAVFQIFRNGTSLDEIMASYQLLVQLEKHFPRVSLVLKERSSNTLPELVVAKEAWIPFGGRSLNMHTTGRTETSEFSKNQLDAHEFSVLTRDVAQLAGALEFGVTLQIFKKLLLYHYLVHVLEGDFQLRETMYKATMSWVFLRESLLSLILGSRKINVRNFIQDCIDIVSGGFLCQKDDNFCDHVNRMKAAEVDGCRDLTFLYGTLEMGLKTVDAIEKLFSLITLYDIHRKAADIQGYTSRADAVRVPLLEMIVDQLSYNTDVISPFLHAFSKAEWKIEIIVHYLRKYCAGSSVHTRKSKSSSDNATFEAILKWFGDVRNVKSITRKMSSEVAKLLLAHGFQAYISLSYKKKSPSTVNGIKRDDSLLEVSEDLICALENIRKNGDIHLSAFEKEALFSAGTILTLDSQI
ncbi:negative regulator of systemic acquired resistance (SNI1) [Wolffia australiana]